MLSDTRIDEFAERGYILVPQVVPGDLLDRGQAATAVAGAYGVGELGVGLVGPFPQDESETG